MTMEYTTDVSALLQQTAATSRAPRGINIKRLLNMRAPLMAGVAAALAVPLMIAIWFIVPREYEATAGIQFSNVRPTILTSAQGSSVSTDYVTYVETQVGIIQGRAVLSRVVERPEIRNLPLIAGKGDPIAFLETAVRARLQPSTELVVVSFSDSQRETALAIVNAAIEEYMKLATSREKTRNDQITRQLIEERDALESKVNTLRTGIINQRDAIGGVSYEQSNTLDPETLAYHENLSRSLGDVTTAETRVEQAKLQIEKLETLMSMNRENPDKPIYDFQIELDVSKDSAVLIQRQLLATADAELARKESAYVEGHGQTRVQSATRNSILGKLKQAEQNARITVLQTRYEQFQLELENAQKGIEDANTRVTNYQNFLDEHATENQQVQKSLAALKEDEAALTAAREDLSSVNDRIRELQVESRAPASIEVVVDPDAPLSPDYGRRLKMMALIAMASCCAGLAVGVLRELTDQQVRTAQDVTYVTDLPLIAVVPHTSVDQLPADARPPLVVAEYPTSITANEIRRILTRIIYPPEGAAELNTCLIASATRGDGKTSLACNLAIALAQANRRVLLVDICARRPCAEKALGLVRGPGLGEVFAGEISVQEAARPTPYSNLVVLGPGLRGKDLIGKLASRDTVQFLERAEETFEHVIIDSPPVLLMSDAKLIAPIVDGVIVVIGAEVSTLGMARRSVQELQQIGANIAGVVLNRVRHMPGGYMRRNLDNYYNYAREANGDSSHREDQEPKRPEAETGGQPSILLIEDKGIRPRRGF